MKRCFPAVLSVVPLLVAASACLVPWVCVAQGLEVNPVTVLGEANTPERMRREAFDRVDGLAWVDDETILIWGEDFDERFIRSVNLNDGEVNWSNRFDGRHGTIALSPEARWVLVMNGSSIFDENDPDTIAEILDAQTGEQSVVIETQHVKRATRQSEDSDVGVFAFGSSDDELLVISSGSGVHGQHAHLYNWRRKRVIQQYLVDPYLQSLSVSEDGRMLGYVALGFGDLLCVYDSQRRRDRILAGEHVTVQSDAPGFILDAPFYSGIQISNEFAIVSRDNPDGFSGNAEIFVINLGNGEVDAHIETPGGHLVFDVDFEHERIAVTGSYAHLAIYDFEGNELYLLEDITEHRNLAISFSADGKRLALGGYENTVSVFEIVER